MEAWKRGPIWRERLEEGVPRLEAISKDKPKRAIDKVHSPEEVNAEGYYGPNAFRSILAGFPQAIFVTAFLTTSTVVKNIFTN